jgi:hypothetical protein
VTSGSEGGDDSIVSLSAEEATGVIPAGNTALGATRLQPLHACGNAGGEELRFEHLLGTPLLIVTDEHPYIVTGRAIKMAVILGIDESFHGCWHRDVSGAHARILHDNIHMMYG